MRRIRWPLTKWAPELASFDSETARRRAIGVAFAATMWSRQVVISAMALWLIRMAGVRFGVQAWMSWRPWVRIAAQVLSQLTVLGLLIWVGRKEFRRSLRQQLVDRGFPICIKCGYDLRGQHRPRCPECGTEMRGVFHMPPEGG
ncbi:MAG: hypothetical protein HY763_04395 [Planctomycetes bacterium]|nr:hypothetical protein [Planctomycetota bacterium]